MNKKLIGLNRWLYTFGINDRNVFVDFKNKLSSTGTITEVFINNGYAFEYKQNKKGG